jgi:hypothetical protein
MMSAPVPRTAAAYPATATSGPDIDLVVIDGNRTGYAAGCDTLVSRMSPGGVSPGV